MQNFSFQSSHLIYVFEGNETNVDMPPELSYMADLKNLVQPPVKGVFEGTDVCVS